MALMFPKPEKRLKGVPKGAAASVPKRRRLSVDDEATQRAGFVDRRSFVHLDGRWFAFGKDMEKIRRQVYDAAKGICMFCGGHVSWRFGEAHHLKPKGSNPRDDRPEAQGWACGRYSFNQCHQKAHGRVTRFGEGAA